MSVQPTGRWVGTIRAGSKREHDVFVEGLRSEAGADLLRRCNLTEYALYQQALDLTVVFRTERPSILAGFLRNRRMWPEFWVFSHPGQEGAEDGRPLIFRWTRD